MFPKYGDFIHINKQWQRSLATNFTRLYRSESLSKWQNFYHWSISILVNDRNTRKMCEICSELTIKTPERRRWQKIGKNIKSTWKGIKSLINLKIVVSSVPNVLCLDDRDTITNRYDIANTFNNYFASIAEIFQMEVVVQYFCNLLIKKK